MLYGTIALDQNGAIGLKNKIPWKVQADLEWFKELTLGHTIVIGANTYKYLPKLKNRKILVLSTKLNDSWYNCDSDTSMATVKNPNKILELKSDRKIFIAGGAKIYQTFLPYIDSLFVTHINGVHDGDVFMPPYKHFFTKERFVREFDGGHIVKCYSK